MTASDIHVEPAEHDLRIRFRIDGVLHEVMRSPRSIQAGVISRLKVMADINIAERRIPQDGRISMKVGGRGIDLRVATLPTVYGEKVVMRILDKGQAVLHLEELGFLPETEERFEQAYRKPYGTILVTGPTGSGKSTTLYATLNQLNTPDRNIITVEDPVEYRLPGINQVQINPKAGLTFASALRSILRSDPDIVLVGEIRDRETADHRRGGGADRPPGAVDPAHQRRRVDAAAAGRDGRRAVPRHERARLRGRATPRRRLCDKCKDPYQPTEAELLEIGWPMERLESEWPTMHRAVGCTSCGRTGYKGRFALHEVMLITDAAAACLITISAIWRRSSGVTLKNSPVLPSGISRMPSSITEVD